MPLIRPSLQQLMNLKNFTQMFRWAAHIDKMPSGLSTTSSIEDLVLRMESSEIPKMASTASEQQIRGHKLYQPGLGEFGGQITLTFAETIDVKVKQFINDYRQLHWATRNGVPGTTAYKEELMFDFILAHLDQQDKPIWYYKLFGCFMSDSDPGGTLDATTADPNKPTIVLTYHYFLEGKTLTF